MDWKEQLELKSKKLNIKKEETNGQIISSSSISNRNNIRSSSNVHRVSVYKEINNVTEKGGKGMITVEGALSDLEVIEKETDDVGAKAIIKALKVMVKFLSTMRTNQLLTNEEKIAIGKARKERQAKEEKK